MKITICNMPMAEGIWKTIGSSLSDVAEAICEFIDNAVSNFRGNLGFTADPRVQVSVAKLGDLIEVIVEDNGTGIKDLDNAFTLAGTDGQESPLNEHGFGMKHALAFMDENNCEWEVLTRTEADRAANRCAVIVPPYDFDGMKAVFEEGWPGELGETGTQIRFTCPLEVFETLDPGQKSKRSFEQLIEILEERLCYTYAEILRKKELRLNLCWERSGVEYSKVLVPLLPQWEDGTLVELPDQVVDLGGGPVTISCRYGSIRPDHDAYLHYAGNMESSGAEIRINGRAIERGLMKTIWGRARHNAYNTFLTQINLRSEDPGALPATRTAKNGFRTEMRKALTLFKWVRANVPLPARISKEHLLRSQLAERKRGEPGVTYVEEEKRVFATEEVNIPADLFVSRGEKVTLYECKVKNTSCLNAYQLRMYWDGCVRDGIQVEEGVLIAQNHPAEVVRLIRFLNRLTGADGRPYKLRTALWAEEGVVV